MFRIISWGGEGFFFPLLKIPAIQRKTHGNNVINQILWKQRKNETFGLSKSQRAGHSCGNDWLPSSVSQSLSRIKARALIQVPRPVRYIVKDTQQVKKVLRPLPPFEVAPLAKDSYCEHLEKTRKWGNQVSDAKTFFPIIGLCLLINN